MADCCLFCDAPATILCDAMIARPIGDYEKAPGRPARPVMTLEQSTLATCDAPCCADHARTVGHICKRPGGCETIDHCIKHASAPFERPFISADKVPGLRRELHRRWRLERMHVVSPPPASEDCPG